MMFIRKILVSLMSLSLLISVSACNSEEDVQQIEQDQPPKQVPQERPPKLVEPEQPPKQIELGQPFKTRLGQYEMTPDKDFIFRVSKIVHDSRGSCDRARIEFHKDPKNTEVAFNCIWDGEIRVEFEYSLNPKSDDRDYREERYLGGPYTFQNFGDYSLEILSVSPRWPTKNPNEYRFTFEVNREIID